MEDIIGKILTALKEFYPDSHIALNYSNNWELLVAVILSAQCTDKIVNIVTESLFKKYPNLTDYLNADIKDFENNIRSTGFYKNKAKNILASARIVHDKYHDQIPKTMEEMITLPGVARKTANIVLGNAYGISVGIAVDTHVMRISQRLRLIDITKIGGKKKMVFQKQNKEITDFIKDADPVKTERELMDNIPPKKWITLPYQLIDHGRSICKAQNPGCFRCPLNKLCIASRI